MTQWPTCSGAPTKDAIIDYTCATAWRQFSRKYNVPGEVRSRHLESRLRHIVFDLVGQGNLNVVAVTNTAYHLLLEQMRTGA